MKIKLTNIYFIYFLLYVSLLVGFYFNEDFALGYLSDYSQHKIFVNLFERDFIYILLNFDKYTTSHSPIYYIFFLFLKKISFNENILRLIVLHLSLLIPYFFFLCLKLKYKFQKQYLKFLLPCIIFFSPYFRSSAIWLGSENLSLIFLSVSIYFFLKYENSKKKKLSYILHNALFLACAAYFRPIYSVFVIFFLVKFFLDLKLSPKFIIYIFFNFLLSLPAIYYVFVLDINFFAMHVANPLQIERLVTQFTITLSIIFFYSIPFLLFNLKDNIKIYIFKIENIIILIVFLYLLIFHFNYDYHYGGGIFNKFSILVFNNSYLFYFFTIIILCIFYSVFISSKHNYKINDLILILILIFLEPDLFIYHETYDPLLYFVFFLLIKNKIYLDFAKKLTDKKFIMLAIFCLSFYILSIIKALNNQIQMPIY